MNRAILKTLFLIVVAFLIMVPVITRNSYVLHVAITMGIAIILASALRLPLITGIFNLGQIAFYAVGSYGLVFLQRDMGISFWLALPLTGGIAAIIALILGYVTIRVKELYFVLVSLAFVEVVRLGIEATPFLGGLKAVVVPRINPLIIPYFHKVEFNSQVAYYYLIWVLVGITLVILYRIENSRIGTILKSIFGIPGETLARSIGINVTSYKVFSLSIGAYFAGIAGGFFASHSGIISPGSFTIPASVLVFIWVVVGGISSFWGPVIGATTLVLIGELLQKTPYLQPILYSCILILVIYLMPKGLIDFPRVVWGNAVKPLYTRVLGG